MKRKFVKYLLGALVLVIGFVAFELIRVKTIYNNSQAINITGNESVYLQILESFGLSDPFITETYRISNLDSVFEFETKEYYGLLWIISNQNSVDIKNISYQIRDLSKNVDGTYINYVTDTPSISISYRKKRNISLDNSPVIYLSDSYKPIFTQKQNLAYWEISNQYSIEFRNDKKQLVYRTDFIDPVELFLFSRPSSLNIIFLQSDNRFHSLDALDD